MERCDTRLLILNFMQFLTLAICSINIQRIFLNLLCSNHAVEILLGCYPKYFTTRFLYAFVPASWTWYSLLDISVLTILCGMSQMVSSFLVQCLKLLAYFLILKSNCFPLSYLFSEICNLHFPCNRSRDTTIKSKSKLKSHYDRQLVGQSVLVSGAKLGPAANFSISLRFSFRQLLFVML
jgi:hypothetical protein